MPNYASGIVNASARLDDINFNNLNGKINAEAKGILNAVVLSQIMDKKISKQYKLWFKYQSRFKK